MKIFIIPTTDWLRHPTPHRHHYLAEAMSKNHEVSVFYFDIFDGEKTWHGSEDIIPAGGKKYNNLILYYFLNSFTHYKNLKKYFRSNEVEIVIGSHPLVNLLAMNALRKTRSARTTFSVDFNDFYPEGASLYFSNKLLARLVKYGGNFLLKKNLRKADLVTAVSSPMEIYAREIGANHVKIIPNGVDNLLFHPMEADEDLRRSLGLGNKILGFVGTVERWFNLEMVIEALPHLRDKDVQLLIVGGGIKTDYLEQLKRLSSNLDIEDRVVTTGIVPYTKVPNYISLMSIGVVPPLAPGLFMGEIALPNKIFQYAACGKPILTYPFPEVVKVAESAVETFEDRDDFVEKVDKILLSSGLNQEGISLAKRHSWARLTEDMLHEIEKWSGHE